MTEAAAANRARELQKQMAVIDEQYRSDSDESLYSDHPSFLSDKTKDNLAMAKRKTTKTLKSRRTSIKNTDSSPSEYDEENENGSQNEEEELNEEEKEQAEK